MAAHWERKDSKKSFCYADRSVKIEDRHITGHIMKASLYMAMSRPDCAVVEFKTAHDLRADLRSFQGLVKAYLAFSKPKEALFTAREAMKAMQQSAKALKLVGDVHSIIPTGREKEIWDEIGESYRGGEETYRDLDQEFSEGTKILNVTLDDVDRIEEMVRTQYECMSL